MAALKEFGLEPQNEGEMTAYSVFDFGIERVSENRRKYKFILEQFGKGGENILNVLAYEVFKANFDLMLDKQIPIVLPPGCAPIAGGEALIMGQNASHTAHMNQKLLAEELRALWERRQDESDKSYVEKYNQDFQVRLFSIRNDKESALFSLNIQVEHLYK